MFEYEGVKLVKSRMIKKVFENKLTMDQKGFGHLKQLPPKMQLIEITVGLF